MGYHMYVCMLCVYVCWCVLFVSARGGFYTTLIRKGLRVVSLNMNYCYDLNWQVKRRVRSTNEGAHWHSSVDGARVARVHELHRKAAGPSGNTN